MEIMVMKFTIYIYLRMRNPAFYTKTKCVPISYPLLSVRVV